MASAKATFSFLGLTLGLIVLGIGGAYCWNVYQTHAVQKDLKAAETALKEKRPKDADQLLATRLDRAKPSTAWAPQALALRFQTLQALNDQPTANLLAQKILNPEKPWVRPGDEAWSQAHLVLANTALANNLADQAASHLKDVLSQPPRGPNDPIVDEAQLGQARIELATGKVEAGRDRLASLHERLPKDSPLRERVEKILGDLNTRMLFALQPYGKDQMHVLEKGDSLDKLSKQYNISADLLMGVNQISDPRRLRIGKRIKIPDLQLSLVVDKSNNTLTAYNYGKFFKRYTVRTGTDEFKTPGGEYTILNKAVNPSWFNQKENRVVPANDPSNELGSRWMGFQGTSLGIHEARDPASLGKYSSNGCVGLARKDVEELYNMVPKGTPLKIEGQINPALMDPSATGNLSGLGNTANIGSAPTSPAAPPAGAPTGAGAGNAAANSGSLLPSPAQEALPETDAAATEPLPEGSSDEEATPTPQTKRGKRQGAGTKAPAKQQPAFGQ